MIMKLSRSLFVLYVFSLLFEVLHAQNKVEEVRAVWLTTNWNLDWPSPGQTPEEQKKELRYLLDRLQQANINTIFFQARIRGNTFYRSKIEPWSPYFQKDTSVGAYAPYDPLAYAIEESHKRGIECHAWIVTFPLGTPKQVRAQGRHSVVAKYPKMTKLYMGEWYLDPGNPETRTYLLRIVDEIVSNYNVDGIQFDYIRYPESANRFPDKDTFNKYGRGKSLKEWRRDNITALVTDIHNMVKKKKPWVQISCSPIGRYRNLDPMRGRWTAYESVHQDAGLWLKTGLMDAVYPMLYYNEADFDRYVDDWIDTSNGRMVVPGLGVYRLLPSEGDWEPEDITRQIDYTRASNSKGQAFYRAANVLDNLKGILDKLGTYYEYPAKLPPLTWLDNQAPDSPMNMQVYRDANGYTTIEWKPTDSSEDQTYTVYETSTEYCDTQNASSIVMTGIHGTKIRLETEDAERGVYYTVTASDRYHNESLPCFPVFFILSRSLEK